MRPIIERKFVIYHPSTYFFEGSFCKMSFFGAMLMPSLFFPSRILSTTLFTLSVSYSICMHQLDIYYEAFGLYA